MNVCGKYSVWKAGVEMLYSPVSSSPAKYVIKARMHNLGGVWKVGKLN